MGVVHLGVDPQGRQVAVKVLRAEVAGDDVARRRLSREVETMRRVRNQHIAEVVDADVTGHRPYIVTRYVPGRPLDELVKQDGPLGEEALVRVGYGVADALAAVHAAGVIHRDLKPGNVMMLDGDPVLIDFGIAQAVDATRLTQTGMFIGTPGYLAPEIIEGQEAGPEIDVHAWAGTLIYAATGQPPFGKGTLEMIFFNITAGKANVDGAPRSLRPILRAALSRDPSRRPTAAELARRMAELLPAPARPAGPALPRVPDEITTVPNLDPPPPPPGRTPGTPGTSEGHGGAPVVPPTTPAPAVVANQSAQANPAAQLNPAAQAGRPAPHPGQAAQAGRQDEFFSLLEQPPAEPDQGDPWPTVRVTGKDLRDKGLLGDAPRTPQARPAGPAPDMPATGTFLPNAGPTPAYGAGQTPAAQPPVPGSSSAWHAPAAGEEQESHEGDIPTRRVRPNELADLVRRPPQPAPGSQAFAQLPPDNLYEQTPHRRQPNPLPSLPTVSVPPPPQPQPQAQAQYQPQPQFSPPPAHPGNPIRSRAHGALSALLLLALVALAVRAPTLVILLTLPISALLRAADMAQPALNERRPATAAGGDVIRVLGQPVALLKSVVYTAGLLLYGAILGLPVTLFLTVFVPGVSTPLALSSGLAVALWTVCAGPGVDGPRRQMRRMLASMFPSRSAAMTVAGVVGLVAVAAVLFTALAFVARTQQVWWQPLGADPLVELLDELRARAQSQ